MSITYESLLYDIYKKFLNNPDSVTEDEKHIVEVVKNELVELESLIEQIKKEEECPITLKSMIDPVKIVYEDDTISNHIFEHYALKKWIKNSNTDPTNRKPIKEIISLKEAVIREELFTLFNEKASEETKNVLSKILEEKENEVVNEFLDALEQYDNEKFRKFHVAFPFFQNASNLVLNHESTIAKKVDVNSRDKKWQTILHKAVQVRINEFVDTIIQKGADINARDSNGITPLHYAILSTDIEITTLLLDNGADINNKASNGKTIIQSSILCGNTKSIKFLLDRGANFSSLDYKEYRVPKYKGTAYEKIVKILDDELQRRSQENSNGVNSSRITNSSAEQLASREVDR
ncbi:ankyrin repeat domain-containing protein [Wolbachia endosymbiont of Pentidionis agamae]|uniref:ankyrin repeat domain-containing protein n=1 Tax=Wolbachia endosymbiont of Pentidionis agamae TaxID=3110435 RepID=UPI002FD2A064